MEHCRRLRLERAASRLKQSEDSVTGIAFEAGYETLDAFIRAFKSRFGMPPTDYRRDCSYKFSAFDPHSVLQEYPSLGKEGCTMEVSLKNVPPMQVVFVRMIGPYAESAGPAWGKLCGWAGRKGLMRGKPVFIGLSHDDPDITPPDKIRYDACLVVTGEVAPEGDIGVQQIGGGDYAVAVHKGPYETPQRNLRLSLRSVGAEERLSPAHRSALRTLRQRSELHPPRRPPHRSLPAGRRKLSDPTPFGSGGFHPAATPQIAR